MLRRVSAIFSVVLVALAGSGCSDFTTHNDISTADVMDAFNPDVPEDTTVLPDILIFDVSDIHYPDVIADVIEDIPTDAGEDIVEGEAGWPCEDSEDCNSGFCLDTPDGRECSAFCQSGESCPRGYDCLMVSGASDAIFVCVHTMPNLCMPCRSDSDCESAQSSDFAACVGDNTGRFCAGQCAVDTDCPRGYVCSDTVSAAGAATRQCLPTDGTCECSTRAIEESASTECVFENAIGRCVGEMVCTPAGLLPCPVSEPSTEICNSEDDDCDGSTDDVTPAACLVRNAFGSCPGTTLCQAGVESCQGPQAELEKCNGIDDNCNGVKDEEDSTGCTNYYEDLDADTWGTSSKRKCLCAATGYYTATRGTDCNDNEFAVKPSAPEACNGIDDNCNSVTDEENALSCRDYYYDYDADSYGTDDEPKCLCVASRPWSALRSGDCNDAVLAVNPGADEKCNGVDDDCDGSTDPIDSTNCNDFYYDYDSDGYGSNIFDPRCQCAPNYLTKYKVQVGGDCNDNVVTINPVATEKCDTIDNDCDGDTDEDGAQNCTQYYVDSDQDGYGAGTAVCKCAAAAPYTTTVGGDCADGDFYRNPSVDELCGDSLDNDCDSKVDEEGGEGCDFWFYDYDRDSYGDVTKSKCLCAASTSTKYDAALGTDCRDDLPAVNPGADEACGNAIDDDCDGSTDEENADNCDTWFYDSDGDHYGLSTLSKCLCGLSGLYRATVGGDCDDNAVLSFPGGIETCAVGDQDCDGTDNEPGASGCVDYFYDGDADDYGDDEISPICLCAASPATGYRALAGGDCNDGDSSINPEQTEVCEPDGTPSIDDNCNGLLNEENAVGCKPYYYDYDRDNHGLKNSTPKCYCTGGNIGLRYTSLVSDDCNDNDTSIAGGLPEYCDAKDNDCDNATDENGALDCTTYYYDFDRDHYGVSNNSECRCAADVGRFFDTTVPGDCDDGNSAIYPGQSVCGVDGSCDGLNIDPLEECDDGNTTNWDGCSSCRISEIRINSQTSGDQSWPSVVLKAGGGWVVAYTSVRAGNEDIAVRTLTSAGVPTGTEVFANSYTSNSQTYPEIAAMSADLVVVWQSEFQDGSGYGVTARIMNADGSAKYPEFLVNGTSANNQSRPAVAVGPENKIYTVWQSYLQDGSYEGVYGRIHTSPGNPATGEILVPQTTTLSQTNPDVTVYTAGSKLVVTWTGEVQIDASTTDKRIFFRIFDTDFNALTNEAQVTGSGVSIVNQDNSAVAIIGTAGFVIAFEDSAVDGNDKGIRYRAFDWNGNALAAPAMANTTTYGMQASPAIIGVDSTNFIIAWWSLYGDSDGSTGIVARRFVRGGTNGNETHLNTNVANYQWYPSLAISSTSLWYAAWMSGSGDGDGSGVYGRTFSF